MKFYEKIENNNFDEIDKNRAIELIEGGNGHLVYNENHFKLQKENEELENDNKYLRERELYLEKRREDIINIFQNQQTNTTIPIQKVKDKIEKLKEKIENLPAEVYPIIEDDLQIKIEVLEELLKKEQ